MQQRRLNTIAAAACGDCYVLLDMKACLRRHLDAGLIECAALSRDLAQLDPDSIMAALRGQFDPQAPAAPIQDCFSDGFYKAIDEIKDKGGEPIGARGTELPSGAAMG